MIVASSTGRRLPRALERFGTLEGPLSRRVAPILLLALTALLCVWELGDKSLWHDEAFSDAVAHSDDETFRQSVLRQESFSGFYYAVIRFVTPLGPSEVWLRAPSVVFALLTTLACYALGRRLFGFGTAVLAASLLSVNLLFVQYAQEARAYALAVCLVTVAGWTLARAIQQPTWPSWLAFGAVSAAAAYAHFFAVFVLAGQLLSLLPLRSRVPWRRVAGAAGLATVLVLPLAAVLFRTSAGGRPYLAQASPVTLLRTLAGAVPSPLGALQGLVCAICAGAAVLAFLRQRRDQTDPVRRWGYWLLACWLATPIVLAGLVSAVWPVFVTRYFLVCLPAVALLVAAGLARMPRAAQAALLLVVLLASAQGLYRYYQQDYKEGENWRGLVQQVATEARPGDSVIFLSHFGRRPFEYYLPAHAGLASSLAPAYPSMPWYHYLPVVGEARLDATGDRARLSAAKPDRIWAVLLWGGFDTNQDDGRSFARILAPSYHQIDQRFYGRYLKLALFERR